MTAALVVAVPSVVLIVVCVSFELRRGAVPGLIDALRAASIVYVVCFGVVPLGLVALDWTSFESSQWHWVFARPFTDATYAAAGVLALMGYAAMVAGHAAVPRDRSDANRRPLATRRRLWAVGGLLATVGLAALILYTSSIGGWRSLLVEAVAFRGSAPPVESPLAFLKNVAPLLLGSCLVFYAVRWLVGGWRAGVATVAFSAALLLALVVLFHQAGRASLAAFLVAFPLIGVIRRGRARAWTAVAGVLGVGVIFLVGKSLFQVLRDPSVILIRAADVFSAPAVAGGELLLEFAFPLVTLANAVEVVPALVPLRWFADLPLAAAHLAPERLLGIELPPTLSMVNTEMFTATGAVPVDLLSFGYFSAGVVGVAVVAGGFGILLGWFERWLPAGPDPVRATLRSFWLILLAQRVMYGDPQLFWIPGFWLLVTTVAVALPLPRVRRVAGTAVGGGVDR